MANATERLSAAKRGLLILFGVFLAALFTVVNVANSPAAHAGEGKVETYSVGDVSWDLLAAYKNHTSAKKQTQAPPSKGQAKTTIQRIVPETVDSSSLWFNTGGAACIDGDGGPLCYDFAQGIVEGGCVAYPPADASYSYGGNAIPLPARGQKGESRLVSWTVKLTKTKIDDVTPYEDLIDPEDPSKGWVEVGEEIDTSYLYEYQWNCNYATAPEVSTAVCATWVKAQLNGPYDQNYKPMKPITEPGGTNTRTPYQDGVYGTEGRPFEEPSHLGEAMQKVGFDPKTDAPTLSIMQNYCIPNSNDDFEDHKIDKSSTLGRYEIPSTTWYTRGYYYHFTTGNTARIFPAAVKSPNYKDGYMIIDITKPSPTKLTTYAKLICWSGTSVDGVVAKIYVGSGTAKEWRVLDWGDSAENYYTWNCGENPPGPDDIRKNDFLQCDTYQQTKIGPDYPQIEQSNYTYHTESYSCEESYRGTNCRTDVNPHTWNCPGGTAGGGQWGDCTCRRISTCQRTVRNACPSGFSDNGTYCYRVKTPQELGYETHGVVPESDGRDVYYSTYNPGIVVDHKPAAPIKSAVQFVNGKPQSLTFADGAYQLESTADPVAVQWTRVRINTRDGRNVNEAGKNVYWEYQYRLAPWSSPVLKNTDVNAYNQPYHGWVDTTNQSAAIAEDRKWDPNANYSYQTQPYSYEYQKPTWHREDNPRPYTYHNEHYCAESRWEERPGMVPGCTWYPDRGTSGCTICTREADRQVKDAPPAGCIDGGSSYLCPTDVMDQLPAPWSFDGQQWVKKNDPPVGWHDDGTQYVSDSPLNDGFTGGIAFNKWRTWPTYEGLKDCTINSADYNDQKPSKYTIKCGDNVTDRTRSAYFRFFMSSTAGSNGWQVTPWWKVTADIQTNFKNVNRIKPGSEGDAELNSDDSSAGKYIRQSYECPGQPFWVNIRRVVN